MYDKKKQAPNAESRLRHNILEMPKEIRQASGIVIYGRRIKSLVFTTDLVRPAFRSGIVQIHDDPVSRRLGLQFSLFCAMIDPF